LKEMLNKYFLLVFGFLCLTSVIYPQGDILVSIENVFYDTPFIPPTMTSGNPIPTSARYSSAAGFMRNDSAWIYVMGGLFDGNIITANCYRYNILADSWETIAPLSLGGVWIGAGVRLGNKIYNLGGTTTLALNQAQDRVQVYDVNSGVWSIAAPMPYGRTFLAAVSYQDSLIYVAGGWGYPGGLTYPDVHVYNSVTNQWRAASNMPAPRCGGVLGISNDTIVYICGGADWVNPAARNTVFRGIISQSDRSVITWDSLGALYPPGNRNSIVGASWGAKGIVVSGGYGVSNATSQCYSYSPGSNTWTQQPNLLTTRTDHSAASVRMGDIWKFVNVGGTSNRSGTNLNTVNILTDSIPSLVSIDPIAGNHPSEFSLEQNYPNPFNPVTKIRFDIYRRSFARLSVFDVLGRELAVLTSGELKPGRYVIDFDGSNLSTGIYFYKLLTDGFSDTKRMVMVK
jgi:N-acetylneuraminic acid mutarotase